MVSASWSLPHLGAGSGPLPLPNPPPPPNLPPIPSTMMMEQLPKGAEAKLVVDWELLGWSWGEVLVILGTGSTRGRTGCSVAPLEILGGGELVPVGAHSNKDGGAHEKDGGAYWG